MGSTNFSNLYLD